MSLQARRQLGYTGGTGKRDDKRHVLLTEDVAEALKDVSGQLWTACLAFRARITLADCFAWWITLLVWLSVDPLSERPHTAERFS